MYRTQYELEIASNTTELEFEQWLNLQEPLDIDVDRISFASWMSIAEAMGVWTNVAVQKWVNVAKKELLAKLSVEKWLEMAGIAGFKEGWGFKKWQEYRETK